MGLSQFANATSDRIEKPDLLTATHLLNEFVRLCGIPVNHIEKNKVHCDRCAAPHLPKIINFIEQQNPIKFVLPAFPGKSPNLAKVTGTWPDRAERSSLFFLNEVCNALQEIYAPGAHILICSDGRVFSDIIGMKDLDITAYQAEINAIINKEQLTNLSTFNLDELYSDRDFDAMREDLTAKFGQPITALKERVRRGAHDDAEKIDREANRMYRGITKFLFEDGLYPGQTKSRTVLQKEAKKHAYAVIQRSNAWSELIRSIFPDEVRLSIHPQTCGDIKLGVKLLPGRGIITPWHGVALERAGEISFVKRFEAEEMGAVLVRDENGRADYYRL